MLVTFLHPAANADDWRQAGILGSLSGVNAFTKRGATTCTLQGVIQPPEMKKKIWKNVSPAA